MTLFFFFLYVITISFSSSSFLLHIFFIFIWLSLILNIQDLYSINDARDLIQNKSDSILRLMAVQLEKVSKILIFQITIFIVQNYFITIFIYTVYDPIPLLMQLNLLINWILLDNSVPNLLFQLYYYNFKRLIWLQRRSSSEISRFTSTYAYLLPFSLIK